MGNHRVRLYAPTVVAPGSTFSHYDTELSPNALMEPFDTPSVQAQVNIDLTPALFRDMGWRVNQGDALIGDCDTTVDLLDEGGLVLGANVQAWNNLCTLSTSRDNAYRSCMEAFTRRSLDSGVLVDNEAGKVMSCAAKNR